jgi:integrase
MKSGSGMFSFSSKLWFNNRRINKVDGYASLYIQVTINRQHDEFDLKLRWPADKIDTVGFKLLPRYPKDPDVSDYNLIIKCTQAKYSEILLTYRLRKEDLTIQGFARELRTFDGKECFITYMRKEAERRYNKKEIEFRTFQNSNSALLQVMAYDNLSLFKNIDLKWIQGFKLYLQGVEYGSQRKKYKPTTVWDILKNTLAYLRLAAKEPMIYVNPTVFQVKNSAPKPKTVYLDRLELRNLVDLQREPLKDVEMRVLKGFLFMCFTGLRISDLYLVNGQWEIQKGFLDFIPHKNRKLQRTIRIPLLPVAKSFMKKSNLDFFDLPNQVQFNETLKTLAIYGKVSKRLTAHVARHTFGYLFMTSVGNVMALKELLGHSSVETTQRYAHLDDEYKYESTKAIEKGFADLTLRIAT